MRQYTTKSTAMMSSDRTLLRTRAGLIIAIAVGVVGVYKAIEAISTPALPIIQEELGVSTAAIVWVRIGLLLSSTVALPVIGRLSDLWDRKKMLLGVLVALALGLIISAFSVSLPMLIVGQCLQGVGIGTIPIAVAIMRETLSDDKSKFGNTVMVGAIWGFTGVAFLLAGPIADNMHYSWLFWFSLIILVAPVVAVWQLVPASPPSSKESGVRLDLFGTVLFAGALTALLVALSRAPDLGWGSTEIMFLFAGSLVLFIGLVAVELRVKNPLFDLGFLRNRSVLIALGLMFASGFIANVALTSVPFMAQQPTSTGYGLGVGATGTSLILVPGILMGAIAPVIYWIERRMGLRAATMIGPALASAGFVLLLFPSQNFGMSLVATLMVLAACGIGMAQAINVVSMSVNADRIGTFGGLAFVAEAVASTTATQLTGTILATPGTRGVTAPTWDAFVAIFGMSLAISGVVFLAGFLLPRRSSNHVADSSSTHLDVEEPT